MIELLGPWIIGAAIIWIIVCIRIIVRSNRVAHRGIQVGEGKVQGRKGTHRIFLDDDNPDRYFVIGPSGSAYVPAELVTFTR